MSAELVLLCGSDALGAVINIVIRNCQLAGVDALVGTSAGSFDRFLFYGDVSYCDLEE